MDARVRQAFRLNVDEFARRCDRRGWRLWSQRAEKVGIDGSTMSRLRHGGTVSAQSIAAIVATFGKSSFKDLFEFKAENNRTAR